jgi:pyruvate dehydrogenase (quinone)
MHSAIQHAVGLGGVAVVTLPGDIAGLEATGETPLPASFVPAALVPAPESVRMLADAINSAGKVAIFAGAGVQGGHDEVS